MINYLRGQAIEVIKTPNNRLILILDVNQIGYEIQIPSRLALDIGNDNNDSCQIFTHLLLREEQPLLYGFGAAQSEICSSTAFRQWSWSAISPSFNRYLGD